MQHDDMKRYYRLDNGGVPTVMNLDADEATTEKVLDVWRDEGYAVQPCTPAEARRIIAAQDLLVRDRPGGWDVRSPAAEDDVHEQAEQADYVEDDLPF